MAGALIACGNKAPPATVIDAPAPPDVPDAHPFLPEKSHEVWITDQSNTYDCTGAGMLNCGGKIYIYKTAVDAFPDSTPEVIDLGGSFADLVKTNTGAGPVRPHFIAFNPGQTYAIVSFVASGHVVIFDAQLRKPVFMVKVGAQAHVALVSPDETYILVANQGGKALHRINADFSTGTFSLDTAATIDLTSGTTPSGAPRQMAGVRPDNQPVVPIIDGSGDRAFVPLRGGGMFVVDTRQTPMAIVGEYTMSAIKPYGLLGVQKGDKVYFSSNVGPNAAWTSIVYELPASRFLGDPVTTPDTPLPKLIYDDSGTPPCDTHGMVIVPTTTQQYNWVADRAANKFVVVDTRTDTVVNRVDLTASGLSTDPAPDQVGRSPNGKFIYSTLRGPIPLTQNIGSLNNAVGNSPGLGVITTDQDGFTGSLTRIYPVTNKDMAGVEHADPHGLAVRDVRNL